MTLHPEDIKTVLEARWGERHPLARGGWCSRFVPKEFVMIYAPRSKLEVDTVMEIIKAGVGWISGLRWRRRRWMRGVWITGVERLLRNIPAPPPFSESERTRNPGFYRMFILFCFLCWVGSISIFIFIFIFLFYIFLMNFYFTMGVGVALLYLLAGRGGRKKRKGGRGLQVLQAGVFV